MREVKVRAWDKMFNKFWFPQGASVLGLYCGDFDSDYFLGKSDDARNFIWCQFTGLKEFYHHDIVETVVSAPWDNQVLITVTGEIVWVNNQWWVDCFQSIDYSGNIGDYDWKKIGTRFDNPELLGDKNGNI